MHSRTVFDRSSCCVGSVGLRLRWWYRDGGNRSLRSLGASECSLSGLGWTDRPAGPLARPAIPSRLASPRLGADPAPSPSQLITFNRAASLPVLAPQTRAGQLTRKPSNTFSARVQLVFPEMSGYGYGQPGGGYNQYPGYNIPVPVSNYMTQPPPQAHYQQLTPQPYGQPDYWAQQQQQQQAPPPTQVGHPPGPSSTQSHRMLTVEPLSQVGYGEGQLNPPPEVAVDPNAFRRFFMHHLQTLTFNSKPAITNLTLFAHQHLHRMAAIVASCLEDHLKNVSTLFGYFGGRFGFGAGGWDWASLRWNKGIPLVEGQLAMGRTDGVRNRAPNSSVACCLCVVPLRMFGGPGLWVASARSRLNPLGSAPGERSDRKRHTNDGCRSTPLTQTQST